MTMPQRLQGGAGLLLFAEDMATDVMPTNWRPDEELGATGLRRSGGYIDEEFLQQLKGPKGVQVFREMSDNEPMIVALLFALQQLLSEINWHCDPASDRASSKRDAEFVDECRDDMSHSWSDLIIEICSMFPYGWAWHELVYKKRLGPWESSSNTRSKYRDGLIGWKKMPLRSQDSLLRWSFDEGGGVNGIVTMPAPTYQIRPIPIEKSLLFRPWHHKGNPEGRSILRGSYRPYHYKKRLEEYEAIGVERDLTGLPVGWVPGSVLNAQPGSPQAKIKQAWSTMVRNVRRDEKEGLLLPQEFDANGNKKFDFGLLTSGGSRTFDTNSIIQRHKQDMLMTVLADFILVGHQQAGSYNMHTDKTNLFKTAINAFAQGIADVFNRHAIPRLFARNGMLRDELPRLVPDSIDPPDLTQLATFMSSMAGLGMQWFPDPTLEKFVRQAADLPQMDKAQEQLAEQMQRQQAMLSLANQHLQAIQMQQTVATGQMQLEQGQQQTAQAALQTAGAAEQQSMSPEDRAKAEAAGKPAPAGRPAAKKAAPTKAGAR